MKTINLFLLLLGLFTSARAGAAAVEPTSVTPEDSSIVAAYQLDVQPAFVGGTEELVNYLQNTLVYPEIAREYAIEGKVFVSAVIDAQGRVLMPRVVRGLGYGCDEEVLRVFSEMPRWIPARRNNRQVPTKIVLPIIFSLTN